MVKRSKDESFKNKMKAKRNNPGRSNASTNPFRTAPGKDDKKGTFFRSKSKIKLLNLYNEKPDLKKMHERPTKPATIDSDRKWFGNVRTIDQKKLETLRNELKQQTYDPYQMLVKRQKLPISLIKDSDIKQTFGKLTDLEPFSETFGTKAKRNKPKLTASNIEEMASDIKQKDEKYNINEDRNITGIEENNLKNKGEKFLEAGQSKRIWEELYKVIDSSDVVCFVLDARDPYSTLCMHVYQSIKKRSPFKHIIFILNKIDLVPKTVTTQWLKIFSERGPTITMCASKGRTFGSVSLINLLRQIDKFHSDKKSISVGFVGYPNVGKSSIINSLRKKNVCKSAPVPGETKVWQFVALTKRIYLIDCPGVVYSFENNSDVEIVLKGIVRVERIMEPEFYVNEILKRASDVCKKIYDISEYEDEYDFIKQVAFKYGKLLKGGEPDILNVGKIIISDWQRGNIPYHRKPEEFNINF